MPDTMETVKKYLPYVLGGAVVIGGIILYRKSSGTTSTSLVPYTPDTSTQTAANAQMAQASLAAQTSGFQTLLSFANANAQRQADLAAAKLNAETTLKIKQAELSTQNKSIKAAASAAKHQSNLSAIGAIAGLAMMFAFCYETTAKAENARSYYRHGMRTV